MSTWSSQDAEPARLAEFLIAFNASFNDPENCRWPGLLSREAQRYTDGSEEEKVEMARYIALGRRRYGIFLAEPTCHPIPCFGLCEPSIYLQLLTPDKKLQAARDIAQSIPAELLKGAIIRCVHDTQLINLSIVEIATLIPEDCPGLRNPTHRRWLVWPREDGTTPEHHVFQIVKLSVEIMKSSGEPCGFLYPLTIDNYPETFTWAAKDPPITLKYLADHSASFDNILDPERRNTGWQMGQSEHAHAHMAYRYCFGGKSNVAVYQRGSTEAADYPHGRDLHVPVDFVMKGLLAGQFEPRAISDELPNLNRRSEWDKETYPYFESLIALAGARELYASLPQAEVDLNVVANSLCQARWARAFTRRQLSETAMVRTAALACVSLFESGHLDFDPQCFEDVLAISSTNNIYASEVLFCDPLGPHWLQPLRHVIGNVGKPGLALLLLPKNPELREADLETWRLVNHAKFNGKYEDCFQSTSLHLSLTGYEQPLNVGHHGARDREIIYVEAVISVHDRGSWMADINPLHLMRGPKHQLTATCTHDLNGMDQTPSPNTLTMIDNWFEYLDLPPNAAVVRARGNWTARLAFATIPLPHERTLVVGAERICWACASYYLTPEADPDRHLFLC